MGLVCKWCGFRMGSEIWTKWQPFCLKPFEIWTKMSRFQMVWTEAITKALAWPFEIRSTKISDFEWSGYRSPSIQGLALLYFQACVCWSSSETSHHPTNGRISLDLCQEEGHGWKNVQGTCKLLHISKIGIQMKPFYNLTLIDYLNNKHVWYSDPYCINAIVLWLVNNNKELTC